MPENREFHRRVLDWLDSQGYPLEMRAAREFQSYGFSVIQSEYYESEERKSREIDVVAHKQRSFGNLLTRFTFVMECKSSKQKPWILFSLPTRISARAMVAQRAATRIGRLFLAGAARFESVQRLPLFQLPAESAYNLTQAFTSGDDLCYASAMTVAQAALALATEHDELSEHQPPILELLFPTILTDARLLNVTLKPDNSVTIDDIDRGALVWRNPVVGMPHTIIQIVSAPALEAYVKEAQVSVELLFSLCANELSAVIKDAEKRATDKKLL